MGKSGKPERTLTDEQFHAVTRALADARRFALFEEICAGKSVSCSDLRALHNVTPATISHHLKELSDAGLIAIEREGRTATLQPVKQLWRAYLKRLRSL